MTKKELIEQIRIAEHNWGTAEESFNNVSSILRQFTDKLVADGLLTQHEVTMRLLETQNNKPKEYENQKERVEQETEILIKDLDIAPCTARWSSELGIAICNFPLKDNCIACKKERHIYNLNLANYLIECCDYRKSRIVRKETAQQLLDQIDQRSLGCSKELTNPLRREYGIEVENGRI